MVEKISPRAGLEVATTRSVGQRLNQTCRPSSDAVLFACRNNTHTHTDRVKVEKSPQTRT